MKMLWCLSGKNGNSTIYVQYVWLQTFLTLFKALLTDIDIYDSLRNQHSTTISTNKLQITKTHISKYIMIAKSVLIKPQAKFE